MKKRVISLILAFVLVLSLLPRFSPRARAQELSFSDVSPNAFYSVPINWAVYHGITNGLDSTHFAPDSTCTRGQVVTFLWRAAGCPEPFSDSNPFSDVKPDAYYYKAVLWAVEKGITNGTSKTAFSPDASCTRAQVVTFLWRAEGKLKVNNPYGVYKSVIQKVKDESLSYCGEGFFYDIDRDGIYELVLLNGVKNKTTGIDSYYCSVYTIAYNTSRALMDNIPIIVMVGGISANVGVYRKNGETVFGIETRIPEMIDVPGSYGAAWSITSNRTIYSVYDHSFQKNTEIKAYSEEINGIISYNSSYAEFNGSRKPFNEYEQWLRNLEPIRKIDGWQSNSTDAGSSLDELMNMCSYGLTEFTDVSGSGYYYPAMLWAVNKGITNGTSEDKFSPDSTCTRGQIVTFLYRDLAKDNK